MNKNLPRHMVRENQKICLTEFDLSQNASHHFREPFPASAADSVSEYLWGLQPDASVGLHNYISIPAEPLVECRRYEINFRQKESEMLNAKNLPNFAKSSLD